jgi:PAS domain S-box-containing protein
VLPENLARGAMRAIERVLSTGETLVAEFTVPVPLPDGEPFHYEARVSPSGSDEVVAVVRDVTSSKRAREALREREEHLRSLVTKAPVIMFAVDSRGVFTAAEGETMSLIGLRQDEYVGRSVFDMFRDVPEVVDAARRALVGEAFTTLVELQERTFEANIAPIWDEGGNIKGAVAVATDITERARAEKALRRSQQELTIRNKIANIFLTIPDEGMYGEVLQVALECTRSKHGIFGYVDEAGDLVCPSLTKHIWDQCQVPDKTIVFRRDTWAGIWGQALRQKRLISSNGPFHVPEGHIPVRTALAAPVIHEGRVIGLLHVANKATDYDRSDRALLKTIADSIAPILAARLQRDRQQEERKRAEEALRQSEAKFRKLAESAAAAIFIYRGTRPLFVNAAMEELTGYTQEQILARELWQFVHPDFQALVRERSHARQQGLEAPSRYVFSIVTKSGEERWVDFTATTIEFEGEPAALGTAYDITERRRAENVLRESEARYRLLAENVTDVIWTADLKLNLTFVSPSISQLTGYTAEESMTLSFEDVLTPVSLGFIKKVYAEEIAEPALEQKDPYRSRTLELEVYRKDGSTVWVEANMAFLRDAAGRPVGLLGVARDVTERKQAHEGLRESEERFRSLSEATFEGIAIHDGTRVLEANQQLATMLGCEVSDIIGADPSRFVTPESLDTMRQYIVSSSEEAYEAVALRIDGTPFPAELRARNAFYQGRKVRLGAIRDITERKRAEEVLQRERDELETRVELRMGKERRYKLTFRELAVLYLVAAGMADKEIAFRLGISHRTASKHVENILSKMGAVSRTEAGVRAIEEGLVESLR